MSAPVVTVDGPASSGKSTLGRRLAVALGLPLLDTGLFYRGVTVAAVRAGLTDPDDAAAGPLAARTRIELDTRPSAVARLRVDGRPADAEAHDPRNAALLARLSRLPAVRAALLEPQRRIGRGGAVAVGRDCGTVVFPRATVKLYLDAPSELRTRRRAAQLRGGGGEELDVGGLDLEVRARDVSDAGRADAPLRPAPDAHRIDTGRHGVDEMVEVALRLCREAGLLPASGRGGGRRLVSP